MSMLSRRILIFGDSHVHALQEALTLRAENGRRSAIEAHRLLKTKRPAQPAVSKRRSVLDALTGTFRDGRSLRSTRERPPGTIGDMSFDDFLLIVRGLSPTDVVVSAVGGNQHAVFSTIQHPQPFDFVEPGAAVAEVDSAAELIPYRTLYGYFKEVLRAGDGATLSAIRNSTQACVAHLLPPPPKRDNAFIEKHHDTRFAAEGIADLGVSNPELRMKFWKLQNRALKEICSDLGIITVPPPAAACESDSFLDRRCYAGDATHANVRYGEFLIEDLERRFA